MKTDPRASEAAAMKATGKRVRDIAGHFGVTWPVIYRWLDRQALLDRNAELEGALRKIVAGPEGRHDHESGCAFEKFACGIAYDALRKS